MSESDEMLVDRMQRGDGRAFEVLYARRWPGVHSYVRRMMGTTSADDVCQDVFLTFMQQARHYDAARGSVAAYLFGIARHKIGRHRRERPTVSLDDAPPRAMCEPGNAESSLERARHVDAVRKAIAALPPRYREVLVLCDLEGLDYKEVATVVSCPVGTVRSRLHRARARLLAALRLSEGTSL